jgi:hypothetical protein
MLSKAVMLAVVFVLIASPATYKLTSGLLGSWIASSAGCATQNGVVLHAAVFVAVLFVLGGLFMRRSYSGYDDMDTYDDDMETYKAGAKLIGPHGELRTIGKWKKMNGKVYQRAWHLSDKKYKWVVDPYLTASQ